MDSLTRDSLWESGHDETVEVNQRALIDKVLARYSAPFVVFRELLQNSDDAQSTTVEIHFETKEYADSKQRESGSDHSDENLPDLKTALVHKWTVKNNGIIFRGEDWDRLKKIADGNPDPERIGAFGVGFYSLFSVTDDPLVTSGEQWMGFYWKDKKDQLFVRRGQLPKKDCWTSFWMPLREDAPMPVAFDLARFLASSITFMSYLSQVEVFFNNKRLLKITKSKGLPKEFGIPKGLRSTSPSGAMTVTAIKSLPLNIKVELMAWVYTSGSEKPPPPSSIQKIKPVATSFFSSLLSFAGASTPQRVATPLPPEPLAPADLHKITENSVTLSIYTAEVDVRLDKKVASELLRSTKKETPRRIRYELIYTGKDEYDASKNEDEALPSGTGNIFQTLRADLEGTGAARVFIGHSTAQTTGIGGHMSARFITTVERDAIDFMDRNVSIWNKELLFIGGFLARAVYEFELANTKTLWEEASSSLSRPNEELQTSLRRRIIHVFKFFTFHQSTPLSEVSSLMEDAFFSCGTKPLPLLSTVGIRSVKDVRMPDPTFTEFLKQLPVIPDDVVTEARPMITTLQSRQLIRPITFEDVLRELRSRPLTETEMIACLTWWCGLHKKGANQQLLPVRAELLDAAVLAVGEPGTEDERIIPLHTIKTFINIRGHGAFIPLQGPLPDDLIPLNISKQFSPDQLTVSLPWTELLIYDWLQYICNPQVCSSNPVYDIHMSATWAEQILTTLARAWHSPLLSKESKESIQALLRSRTCIPTSAGMKIPQDAYFAQADIFHDLPVVRLPSDTHIKGPMERLLQSLGVRRHVELQLVFDRMIKTNEWTVAELVKYLVSVQSTLTQEEWQRLAMTAFFFKERIKGEDSDATKPRRYPAKQLYEPSKVLRDMKLPVIDWGVQHKWKPASEEAKFLFKLGLMRYPPLDVLVNLCGSPDTALRHVSFKYLVDNLPAKYSEYDPMQFAEIAFIPALKNGHVSIGTPKEVFSAPQWSALGLAVVAPTLTPDVVSKLKIRQHPPSALLISLLEKTPPKSEGEATEWFTILAGQISAFSQSELIQISHLPIVPVSDKGSLKHYSPSQCFFGTDAKTTFHSKLFLFVNFGPAANSFLNACGTKQEPSIEEIAHMLLSNPHKFFELAGGSVSYLNELRNIAMNYKLLSSGTIARMKRAPILLGYQRKIGDKGGEDLDDEEEWNLQYDLKRPEDIVIADDTVALQFFGHALFTAPQEDQLEAFYMQLGSRRLSSLVKEEFSTSAEIKNHKSATDIRALILERLPLFLHEHTHAKTRVSYSWLNNPANFIVKTYGKISVKKRLTFGTTKLEETQETSAVAKRFNYGPIQLWVAGNSQVDMYEVATTLNRLIFESPKASDALLFMTLLSTDLKSLKRRGYNVDRILRQQKANREAQAEEAARMKAQNVKLLMSRQESPEPGPIPPQNVKLMSKQEPPEPAPSPSIPPQNAKLMSKEESPEPSVPSPIPPKSVTSAITGPPPTHTSESEKDEGDSKPRKHASMLKSWKNLKQKFGETIGSNFGWDPALSQNLLSHVEDGASPVLPEYSSHQSIGTLGAGSVTSQVTETVSVPSKHSSHQNAGAGSMSSGQVTESVSMPPAYGNHQSIGTGADSMPSRRGTESVSVPPQHGSHQSLGTAGVRSTPSGPTVSVPGQVTPLSNISTNIDMAIMACRPEHRDLLRNTEEMEQVKELLDEGYCDISGQIEWLIYVGTMGDTKIYVSDDVRETQTFVARHKESLRRFIAVMNTLSSIYNLPKTTLHVFYDLESCRIGFNRDGSIFFNLRYWEVWHDEEVSKQNVAPALISWYLTLAHEIAHNLVQPHNSEHEFYFSVISEKFFMRLVKKLQQ